MASPRHESKESLTPLSEEWKKVIENYNISETLAKNLRNTALEEKIVLGMRLDSRTRPLIERPTAPKPSYVKLKTCNWGWMKDFIPVDQEHLAKSVDNHIKVGDDSNETKSIRHPKEIKKDYSNVIRSMTQTISLHEIIDGIEKKEFELITTDPDRISVRPISGKGKTPSDANVIFSIDPLNKRETKPISPDNIKQSQSKPAWWQDGWGSFETLSQLEFPAQYQIPGKTFFKNLEIFAAPISTMEGETKLYPFSKDNDGLLSSINLKTYNQLKKSFPEALQVINTFLPGIKENPDGQKKLIQELTALKMQLGSREKTETEIKEIMREVRNFNTENFGAGALYDMHLVNRLNTSFDIRPLQPVQHGNEFENPTTDRSKLSSMDEPTLFIGQNGIPVIIFTEKQYAEKIAEEIRNSTDENKFVFRVHAYRDLSMTMWGQVVAEQLDKNIPIDDNRVLVQFIKQNYKESEPNTVIALQKALSLIQPIEDKKLEEAMRHLETGVDLTTPPTPTTTTRSIK